MNTIEIKNIEQYVEKLKDLKIKDVYVFSMETKDKEAVPDVREFENEKKEKQSVVVYCSKMAQLALISSKREDMPNMPATDILYHEETLVEGYVAGDEEAKQFRLAASEAKTKLAAFLNSRCEGVNIIEGRILKG